MKKYLLLLFPMFLVFGMTAFYSAYAGPVYNPATGHWYEIVKGNWDEAESAAIALGGHLVTINDADEEIWLRSNIPLDCGERYWIGLNDTASEGTFVWSSGEAVTYTNWHSGSPDVETGDGEDYGYIGTLDSLELRQWDDAPINYTGYGIAEWGEWFDPFRNPDYK